MRKFKVVIPEKRVETIPCLWEVEAETKEEVMKMLEEGDFLDNAQYVDTLESPWGFEVEEYYYDQAEIEEDTDE
jgi:hypothetical protein